MAQVISSDQTQIGDFVKINCAGHATCEVIALTERAIIVNHHGKRLMLWKGKNEYWPIDSHQ